MDCVNCGAPLPAHSNVCKYCKTLNDADLRALQRQTVKGPASGRKCPHCEATLETIDLQVNGPFLIERCDKCLGMFFDPNELETLLDASVSSVFEIDHQRISQIIEEESRPDLKDFKYIRCPVCNKVMNRKAFGSRSGVVVDRCREHGVWLDGGELAQLIKWTKAGGQILEEKRRQQEMEDEQRKRRIKQQIADTAPRPLNGRHHDGFFGGPVDSDPLVRVVRAITRWLH